ncbi:hypothetical protein ASG92_06940 [Arthrobacter sp. Soil736]|nr:hypothetical protein ASG92_06940 [Arthrobacter sp. Soil736]
MTPGAGAAGPGNAEDLIDLDGADPQGGDGLLGVRDAPGQDGRGQPVAARRGEAKPLLEVSTTRTGATGPNVSSAMTSMVSVHSRSTMVDRMGLLAVGRRFLDAAVF